MDCGRLDGGDEPRGRVGGTDLIARAKTGRQRASNGKNRGSKKKAQGSVRLDTSTSAQEG